MKNKKLDLILNYIKSFEFSIFVVTLIVIIVPILVIGTIFIAAYDAEKCLKTI